MSYTTTPNYGLLKPIEGADADAWGGHLNTTIDPLDTQLRNVQNSVTTIYRIKGGWNASTNSPALSNGGGGGVAGDVYTVTTAGSTSIDGNASWAVGDQIQNTGSAWLKVSYSTAFGNLA